MDSVFKCGMVGLIGRPNAGKSSLINTVIGDPLCVVTSLPQTTRRTFKGIYSTDSLQLIFMDTPGIHEGDHTLNDVMVKEGLRLLQENEVDSVAYLIDLSRPPGKEEDFIAKHITKYRQNKLLVFNKSDICPDAAKSRDIFYDRYPELGDCPAITLSATAPEAKELFLDALDGFIPQGPPLFPLDELSDEPLRGFAVDYLQKAIIAATREEVPHATCAEVITYKETEDKHYIDAAIHVETKGQKGILIGQRGSTIKKIRQSAERAMKRLVGMPVKISVHVKISPKWRDKKGFLRDQGFQKQ